MLLARRPTRKVIGRFIRQSQDLPLSYGPGGNVRTQTVGPRLDELTVAVGTVVAVLIAASWPFRDYSAAMTLAVSSNGVRA